MSDKSIFIEITNANVEGVDTNKRAQSLKHFCLNGGKLIPSSIPILHDINFACKEGDKVAFIGGNGSGKSSLLKVIAGIYPLKSGKIKICGQLAAIIEMGVGFEFGMTGRDNIKIAMIYNNMLDKYTKKLEEEIIEFSELKDKIDLPIKTYSSGMLSRLAFSTSIFQNPDILLLDEVFAVGDQHFVNKSIELMKDKFKTIPISILVSHQEHIIKENCNRCLVLKDGKIVIDSDPYKAFEVYNAEQL
jgi:lipopolysaccharide transport system ATP-binding protein